MSQQNNTQQSAKASETKTAASLLCKTFTETQLAQFIDPLYLLQQIATSGLQYQPQTPIALQARAYVVEDIKTYIANVFAQQGVDIETEESIAKQINVWFEAALIKSNPYIAQQSGAISPERIQEVMAATGMFSNPFAAQMGAFGMQQPGFGGFGAPQFGGGFGSFGMPQTGYGYQTAAPAANPLWKSRTPSGQKSAAAQPQQTRPNYGMNPMMGGMNPMMGGMGMGFPGMNPMFSL